MRAQDFINEAAPSDPATPSDYQQMLNFVRASRLEGVPPEQQIAVSLFKELQRQQTRNNELEKELGAAEQRIDMSAQRTDMYGKQLKSHQAQLDQERESNKQHQAATDELDQQYSDRAQASQKQIEDLAARLNTIKSKPGIDQDSAAALEKQIQELSQNGISAEKYKQLEQSIAAVQGMGQVDHNTMADLIAQVNDAKVKADELDKAKQSMGDELEKSNRSAMDQLAQIQQQLAHFREVEQTVAALQPMVTDILPDKLNRLSNYVDQSSAETAADIGELEQTIDSINAAMSARQNPQLANQMVSKQPVAPAAPVAPAVAESQFFKAIKWATNK